jgi:2-oxoglutarate dehydrogenase complex dehydrogenase (E1) component-like enzyme
MAGNGSFAPAGQTSSAMRLLPVPVERTMRTLRSGTSSGLAPEPSAAATGAAPVLADPSSKRRRSADRVLLCSGKIAIDLLKRREQTSAPVAVIRVEQLYPLPEPAIVSLLEKYGDDVPVYWVQEEPENMGACSFMKVRLSEGFRERWQLKFICRDESASPATGSKNVHKLEQEALIDAAMDVDARVPAKARKR